MTLLPNAKRPALRTWSVSESELNDHELTATNN
jgi:hypothetical protein